MKRIFNPHRFGRLGAVIFIAAALVITPTFAQEVEEEETPLTTATLCSRIDAIGLANQNRVTTRKTTMTASLNTRLTTVQERKSTADDRIVQARTAIDERFEQRIVALQETFSEEAAANNASETQLAAIETFKTNMIEAETDRRTAVDEARTTYRTAVVLEFKSHQAALIAAAKTYEAAVATAFGAAKANCTSASALPTLRSDLKAAKNALTEARSTDERTAEIRSLIADRNEAIQSANQTFAELAKEYATTLADELGVASN